MRGVFLGWLEERGVALVDVRTADVRPTRCTSTPAAEGRDALLGSPTRRTARGVKILFRFLCRRGYVLSDPSGRSSTRGPRSGCRGRPHARGGPAARGGPRTPDTRGPAGPRDPRELLRDRGPRGRDGSLKTHGRGHRGPDPARRAGKGSKDRNVPLTRAAADGDRALPRQDGRPRIAGRMRSPAPLPGLRGGPLYASLLNEIVQDAARGRGSRSTSPATRCGTPSRRTS